MRALIGDAALADSLVIVAALDIDHADEVMGVEQLVERVVDFVDVLFDFIAVVGNGGIVHGSGIGGSRRRCGNSRGGGLRCRSGGRFGVGSGAFLGRFPGAAAQQTHGCKQQTEQCF